MDTPSSDLYLAFDLRIFWMVSPLKTLSQSVCYKNHTKYTLKRTYLEDLTMFPSPGMILQVDPTYPKNADPSRVAILRTWTPALEVQAPRFEGPSWFSG